VPPEIARAVAARQRADQQKIASLSSMFASTAPGRLGRDGGMHPVFLQQLMPEGSTDMDGRLIARPKAPGTVPNHVNPPIDPTEIVAALGLAGTPTAPIAGRVPVPRPDPRGPGVRVAAARSAGPLAAAPAGTASDVPTSATAGAAAASSSDGSNMFSRMMAPVASTFSAATSWMGGSTRSDQPPAAAPAAPSPTRAPPPRPARPPVTPPRT
jgi:hypothetical protein